MHQETVAAAVPLQRPKTAPLQVVRKGMALQRQQRRRRERARRKPHIRGKPAGYMKRNPAIGGAIPGLGLTVSGIRSNGGRRAW